MICGADPVKVFVAVNVCAVPRTSTVSVAAGNVKVKLLAELVGVNKVTPPPADVSLKFPDPNV